MGVKVYQSYKKALSFMEGNGVDLYYWRNEVTNKNEGRSLLVVEKDGQVIAGVVIESQRRIDVEAAMVKNNIVVEYMSWSKNNTLEESLMAVATFLKKKSARLKTPVIAHIINKRVYNTLVRSLARVGVEMVLRDNPRVVCRKWENAHLYGVDVAFTIKK